MQQIKWFERTFDFSFHHNIFPAIIERLAGTSLRLAFKMRKIKPGDLTIQIEGQWSIQEQLGHLIDLEPLWQGRLADILGGATYMRETDLSNRQTDAANYNDQVMGALLAEFTHLRHQTVSHLEELREEEVYQAALHPRLDQPMRVMDLFLFVAEHDDHHLASMSQLAKKLASNG